MLISIILKSVHLLGVGLVLGSVILTSILVAKNDFNLSKAQFLKTVRSLGSLGALLAIASGIAMALRYKIPIINNWSLDIKLALIAIDGLLAQLIFLPIINNAIQNQEFSNLSSKLKKWSFLSVLIIITIIVLSVYRTKIR